MDSPGTRLTQASPEMAAKFKSWANNRIAPHSASWNIGCLDPVEFVCTQIRESFDRTM
jgi:hypothetical protein